MEYYPCPSCSSPASTRFHDIPCPTTACCSECKRLDIQGLAEQPDWSRLKIVKQMVDHIQTYHNGKSKSHSGNGAPNGPFAFTFTKSPTDDISEDDMVQAVKKLVRQRTAPVKSAVWYLEYGNPETKEHPHIHGMYETFSGGRIPIRQFKRCWSIWDESRRQGQGFRGGYHRPVRNNESYDEYIKKCNGLHEIIGVRKIEGDNI